MKVLWLSRHEMTGEQMADLRRLLEKEGLPDNAEFRVVWVNMTFPAQSRDAVEQIRSTADREGFNCLRDLAQERGVIAGVFPAHIAARLARSYNALPAVLVPVSVPAPATAGEIRGGGFAHSHWEWV